jgi:hypothetical protein
MEGLLNALLDLSKLDAGVVESHPVGFPINKVFNQVAGQFQPVAQARGIRLRFASSRLWVYSDPALVERVLANLVSNALRYTEHGGVLVGVRRVGKDWVRCEDRKRDSERIPEPDFRRVFPAGKSGTPSRQGTRPRASHRQPPCAPARQPRSGSLRTWPRGVFLVSTLALRGRAGPARGHYASSGLLATAGECAGCLH